MRSRRLDSAENRSARFTAGEIDLTGIVGEVVLTCSTDDASGGTEGPGAFTDTKTFTVG